MSLCLFNFIFIDKYKQRCLDGHEDGDGHGDTILLEKAESTQESHGANGRPIRSTISKTLQESWDGFVLYANDPFC